MASKSCFAASEEIQNLLTEMRKLSESSNKLDFDTPNNLSDSDYVRLTGIDKQQFMLMHNSMTSVRPTPVRSSRTALALLVKLQTGLSLPILSTLFGIKKQSCSKAIHADRSALTTDFVPKYLGFGHITHKDIIESHTSTFAKVLFGGDKEDTTVCVADGNCIYIEKSSNYSFQRRSFTVHKGRPLVKPMMLVASDGYWKRSSDLFHSVHSYSWGFWSGCSKSSNRKWPALYDIVLKCCPSLGSYQNQDYQTV